jgi:hypothetical protein
MEISHLYFRKKDLLLFLMQGDILVEPPTYHDPAHERIPVGFKPMIVRAIYLYLVALFF